MALQQTRGEPEPDISNNRRATSVQIERTPVAGLTPVNGTAPQGAKLSAEELMKLFAGDFC